LREEFSQLVFYRIFVLRRSRRIVYSTIVIVIAVEGRMVVPKYETGVTWEAWGVIKKLLRVGEYVPSPPKNIVKLQVV